MHPGLDFEQFAYFVIIGAYPALEAKEITQGRARFGLALVCGGDDRIAVRNNIGLSISPLCRGVCQFRSAI